MGVEEKIIMEKIVQFQTTEIRLQNGQTLKLNFVTLLNILDSSAVNVSSNTNAEK